MSVLVNFAIFPTDREGDSASPYVSKVIHMIKESGVDYKLSPMATVIETETMAEALSIIQKAHDILAPNHSRIYSAITMDIRPGKSGRMTQKVASIESKIGEVNK